jgi:hypothetical protein
MRNRLRKRRPTPSLDPRPHLARAGRCAKSDGDIDGAAKDYNKALEADEEIGVKERRLAGLEAIHRPVVELDWDEEDEPE